MNGNYFLILGGKVDCWDLSVVIRGSLFFVVSIGLFIKVFSLQIYLKGRFRMYAYFFIVFVFFLYDL